MSASLSPCASLSLEMRLKAAFFLAAVCVLHLSACSNQDEKTRAKIADAEQTGRQAAQAVENYNRKNRRFPAQIEEAYIRPAALKDIKLLSVDRKTGTVRVVLAFAPV